MLREEGNSGVCLVGLNRQHMDDQLYMRREGMFAEEVGANRTSGLLVKLKGLTVPSVSLLASA